MERRRTSLVRALAAALLAGCAALLPTVGEALAEGLPCAAAPAGSARAAGSDGPFHVRLEDGRRVRLSAIRPPAGDEGKVFAAALGARVAGRTVHLYTDGEAFDRGGDLIAQVFLDEAVSAPIWLQERLVEDGAAIVDGWATHRSCLPPLLAAEAEARDAKRGGWATKAFSVVAADAAGDTVGTFAIIEGVVRTSARAGATHYLNFGQDRTRDFTLVIPYRVRRVFEREGIDLMSLEGARVRARGYVVYRGGPAIEMTHPDELERPAP